MMGIMDDELDIDTAQTKEDKENATRAKASKTWRILRLSAKSKLAAFDKIEDGKNLKLLFEVPQPSEGTPHVLEGGTPQAHETTTKASSEGESGDPGQEHGLNNSEKGNTTVATERTSADSKDAAAADT
jgi:THO complex subunit 1